MLAGIPVCEQDWQKLMKSTNATGAPGAPMRKNKVGRPRRSREWAPAARAQAPQHSHKDYEEVCIYYELYLIWIILKYLDYIPLKKRSFFFCKF